MGTISSVGRDSVENGNKKRSSGWDAADDDDYPLLRPDAQLAGRVPLLWGGKEKNLLIPNDKVSKFVCCGY